jgi:hypothetical protein
MGKYLLGWVLGVPSSCARPAVDDPRPHGKSFRSPLNDSMKEREQWKDPET